MRYHDDEIIDRSIEELQKLGRTINEIAEIVGCPPARVRHWLDGIHTPSAYYLRRFHEIGCDVLYILTGKRYTITGGDTDVRP